MFSYPSVWYEQKNRKFATTTCYFQSTDEKQKQKFLRNLRADKRIIDKKNGARSREQIKNTIRYGRDLKETRAAFINPFIFTPLPGAPHFSELEQYATKNTDEGYSHEFCTINVPNREWSKDELNMLRVRTLIEGNGLKGYVQAQKTGTWAVGK